MMNVREMRMAVPQYGVIMAVGMRLAPVPREIMAMLVMLVMAMLMIVGAFIMPMFVIMLFGKMQP